jgi:hypothetical protein
MDRTTQHTLTTTEVYMFSTICDTKTFLLNKWFVYYNG